MYYYYYYIGCSNLNFFWLFQTDRETVWLEFIGEQPRFQLCSHAGRRPRSPVRWQVIAPGQCLHGVSKLGWCRCHRQNSTRAPLRWKTYSSGLPSTGSLLPSLPWSCWCHMWAHQSWNAINNNTSLLTRSHRNTTSLLTRSHRNTISLSRYHQQHCKHLLWCFGKSYASKMLKSVDSFM